MYRRKCGKFNRRMMKRIMVVLIACILLTACAGGGGQDRDPSQEDGTQVSSDNWKNGFQDSGQNPVRDGNTRETPYHTIDFSTMELDGPTFDVSDQRLIFAFGNEEAFFLKSYLAEDGWKYSLQQYDIGNGSLTSNDRVFQEENLQGYFDGLCISGEKELAARFVSEDGEGNPQEIRLFTFDREGGNVKNVLLDYAYREPTWGPMMAYNCFLSDGNYFYLINYLESGLLVFDREGKEVRRDMPDASGDSYYTAACTAPDGSVIVSKVNMANQKTTLFYLQGDKENRLGEIPSVNQRAIALGGDGSFYYFDNNYLIQWNTSTGEKKVLLDGVVAGIDTAWLSAITFSVNGRVLLHSWSRTNADELEILTCSEEEVETEGTQLVFAVLEEYMDLFYRSLPVEYSKEHPQNQVTLQTHDGEPDAYRTRVIADIMSGGGPDILLLTNEDARNLYRNGALLDLTEYLDPELKEKIFPSALERGVMDGKLIGVDPQLQGYVMMVSNAVWEGDSWTIEDVVKLVDVRKPKYLFASPNYTNSPGYMLTWFFSEFPEKSPFLDLEAGTCDFENEMFIRLLEICKEYGEKPALEENQIYEMLKTGECLSTVVFIVDLAWFSREMKPLEKSCHFVGFPGQEGYGVTGSYEMLVVNANSENKEAALEFLWDLFSLKTQQGLTGSSVREDVIRESVHEKGTDFLTTLGPGYDLGNGRYKALEAKEDGSSFLEEYVTALKGLEGQDSRTEAVTDIVEGEAAQYFAGDRSAEEIAKIIQNRVQLYLDENR